ncbi:MAG TPA: hypothetical protein VGD88_09630 [Opitutaceae bacterium]
MSAFGKSFTEYFTPAFQQSAEAFRAAQERKQKDLAGLKTARDASMGELSAPSALQVDPLGQPDDVNRVAALMAARMSMHSSAPNTLQSPARPNPALNTNNPASGIGATTPRGPFSSGSNPQAVQAILQRLGAGYGAL